MFLWARDLFIGAAHSTRKWVAVANSFSQPLSGVRPGSLWISKAITITFKLVSSYELVGWPWKVPMALEKAEAIIIFSHIQTRYQRLCLSA